MDEYKAFVQNVIKEETPEWETVLKARQQFLEESKDNVLRDTLMRCITTQKGVDLNWWGLLMCNLFEIHLIAQQLGIC